MAKFEEEAAKFNIKTIVITMILSSFGFLVAMSWRDAIKGTIEIFIPKQESLIYIYFAAFLITTIAVVVTYILVKLQKIDILPEKKIIKKLKKLNRKKKK